MKNPKIIVSSIKSAADLIHTLESLSLNDGDKISLVLSFANRSPESALRAFAEILKSYQGGDWNLRSLAIQGFAQLGCSSTLKEMRDCRSEPALEILRLLRKELNNSNTGNELTRWSAAMAMRAIGYSSHSLNCESIPRLPEAYMREIEQQMLDKRQRIREYDSQGHHTNDYDDYLSFWVFGPVQRLFRERHQKDTGEVLNRLSEYGVLQAFKTQNADLDILRRVVFPRLVKMARKYRSNSASSLQNEYFELFMKSGRISLENTARFAEALTFQYSTSHDAESLQNATMEELHLSIQQSRQRSLDLKNFKETIQSLSEFQYVEMLSSEKYDQYMRQEEAQKMMIEKQVKNILNLDSVLSFNRELLSKTVASFKLSKLSEHHRIRTVSAKLISSSQISNRKSYSTLLTEYEYLNKTRDDFVKHLDEILQASNNSAWKGSLATRNTERKAKRKVELFGMIAFHSLGWALLADIMGYIVAFVVVIGTAGMVLLSKEPVVSSIVSFMAMAIRVVCIPVFLLSLLAYIYYRSMHRLLTDEIDSQENVIQEINDIANDINDIKGQLQKWQARPLLSC